MKLKELIEALNKAKEMVGPDVDVKLVESYQGFDEPSHIEDVVLNGTKSLAGTGVDDETTVYITH